MIYSKTLQAETYDIAEVNHVLATRAELGGIVLPIPYYPLESSTAIKDRIKEIAD